METYFGFDEESVDSETSSLTSYNTDLTDHTPATPEEDLEDVCHVINYFTNLNTCAKTLLQLSYTTVQKFGVSTNPPPPPRSYVHEDCIYFIKNAVKQLYCEIL